MAPKSVQRVWRAPKEVSEILRAVKTGLRCPKSCSKGCRIAWCDGFGDFVVLSSGAFLNSVCWADVFFQEGVRRFKRFPRVRQEGAERLQEAVSILLGLVQAAFKRVRGGLKSSEEFLSGPKMC